MRAESEAISSRRERRFTAPELAVAGVLLAWLVGVMVWTTLQDSPTYDEPSHIGAGAAYVQLHDLRWSPVHPPLARVLAGLPLSAAGVETPSSGPVYDSLWDYELGRTVIYDHESPQTVLLAARLPFIALAVACASGVFLFARHVFGPLGGILSLASVASDPNLLAHGRLATTDAIVAICLFATAATLYLVRSRSVLWYVVPGSLFGFALLAKFTAIPMALPFALLIVARYATESTTVATRVARASAATGVMAVTALVVLWAVYLAIDPAQRFAGALASLQATHDAATGPLRTLIELTPLPAQYRFGVIFNIRTDQELRAAYLLGRHYRGGWWAFYPLALVVKTPLPLLGLWIAGAVTLIRRAGHRLLSWHLLFPMTFFLLFAMGSNTNIGLRHILLVPLTLAFCVGAIALVIERAAQPVRRRRIALVVGGVVLAWCSTALQAQGPISYVSDVLGGHDRAHAYLVDSNVDWGQDLKRLAGYLRANHPDERTWLAYFGTVNPAEYGIDAQDPTTVEPEQVRGVVAVSVSRLNASPAAFAWIRETEPIAVVNGSILVFRR